MLFFGHIYERLNAALEPEQWAVSLVLVGVIAVASYALVAMSPVERTALAVWLIAP
jgi:multisubunit Na+/H+ antiporter MnhG subunit